MKDLTRFIGMFLLVCSTALLSGTVTHASEAAQGKVEAASRIEIEKIVYFVGGYRIRVKAKVEDVAGVSFVRCYFRSAGGGEFLFVDMERGDNNLAYEGLLPAPVKEVDSLEYLFLAVNSKKQITATPTFIARARKGKALAWQVTSAKQSLKVSTERLSLSPDTAAAFSGPMALSAAAASMRFGTAYGLYAESPSSPAGSAAVDDAVVKESGRVSPWIYAGAGAVVAGAAAVAAVSIAGEGEIAEMDPVTGILNVQGRWSGTFRVVYADGSAVSDSISLSLSQFGNSVTGRMTTGDGSEEVTGSVFGNFFNMDSVFSCPTGDNGIHFEFTVTHSVFTISFISGVGCPGGTNFVITGGSGTLLRE